MILYFSLAIYFMVVIVSVNECRSIPTPFNNSTDVCTTAECVHIAEYIKGRMDESVDPCDDFYDFACGQFENRAPLGSNAFAQLTEVITRQILYLLNSTGEFTNNDSLPLQKAQQFFSACVNGSNTEEPMLPIYKKMQQFGIWPLQKNEANDKFDLISVVKRARLIGFDSNSLFTMHILPSSKDNSKQELVISPPILTISIDSDGMLSKSVVMRYAALMILVGIQFSQYSHQQSRENSDRQFEVFQRVMEVLQFETQIAQALPKLCQEKSIFKSFNVSITIEEAQRQYPFINWLEFLQANLGPEVQLSESEYIAIESPEYLRNLQSLFNPATKRIMVNYVLWRYILHALKILRTQNSGERWRSCLAITVGCFDLVLGAKYVEIFFSDEKKQPVVEMIDRIKAVMYTQFGNYSWMDAQTSKNVFDKINAMVTRIGYTPDMMDFGIQSAGLYESITVNPEDYFSTAMSASKFVLDFIASTLHQTLDRNKWPYYMSTLVVNAFYIPTENSMTIPAALLQKEFYSNERPHYLNYGSLGFVIGHELSHAFDNMGRLFDKYGHFNTDLWGPASVTAYEEKSKCFIDQYNNYRLESIGVNVNGVITLGENIADNEGITKAYTAYQVWAEQNGREPMLPTLKYTPQQLFWISAGNVWCTKYSSEIMKIAVRSDPHAPSKFRVNGVVSNHEQFSNDFSCPIGSKMNPVKKCSFK